MKPLSERLNDRLELRNRRSWEGGEAQDWLVSPLHAPGRDPEVDELVTLAGRLQSTSHLQADPDFASQLERRLLIHHAALGRKQPAHQWFFPRLRRMNPALGIAAGFCLLVLFLGTSMLVVAARITNPDNPLYVLKRLEQHLQVSFTNSPANQAELDLEYARERLHALTGLTNPAREEAYRQALADLDFQVNNATSAISSLSAVPERNRLRNELASLEIEARHTLRAFLPQLNVHDCLITTDALGRLGDTVPRLQSVEIVLSAHSSSQTIISISGNNIQPGAHLLMDGQAVEAQGSFQNGLYVFTLSWSGSQLPKDIGIMNTDGTAAQTTAITLKSSNEKGDGGSGTNDKPVKGNTGGKPDKTPTLHH
jgi:hypothetical protein